MDNQIHLLKLISCHMVQIKMAVIVIVYESGVPANLYYMVREPEYESTLQEYLKSGGVVQSSFYAQRIMRKLDT